MSKNKGIRLQVGLIIAILISTISGIALYHLSQIPFGIIFDIILYLFLISLVLVLILMALLCFRAAQHGLRWLGVIPVLLAIVVVMLMLIIKIDYRMLYFKSLPPSPSKAEWIEDLHYLAQQMEKKHRDLFALVSREEWEGTVAEIEHRIPEISNHEIVMELFKLSALPNDNHSFPFIMVPCFDLHCLPFQVYGFPEDWYIVNAGREYTDFIGSRIVNIGSKSIEDIYDNYPILLATENEFSRKERFTYMVIMLEWLAYHGIIDNMNEVSVTLKKNNGQQIDLMVPSVKFYPHFLWSNIFTIDNDSPPVFRHRRKDYYWFEYMEASQTLLVHFNQCENQPGRETAEEFTRRLEDFTSTHNIERCMVDIRNNDGGNRVYDELIRVLRDNKQINRPGGLIVFIGRHTFSAAVMFATQLQLQTNAIFIGEPTGQGPIFFGGPTLIELPNSHLEFTVSTHLTIAGLPFDERDAIFPDIPIEYTHNDFLKGRDPVLEAALVYKSPEQMVLSIPEVDLEKYTGRYLLNEVQIVDIDRNDNKLCVHFSDYIPNSDFTFLSDLYPTSNNIFKTKLAGVHIEFPKSLPAKPESLLLYWMGSKKILYRAPKDYVSAFEKISQGDIDTGCADIKERRELYLDRYPDLESILNRLGYVHLRHDSVNTALKIFQLNVDLFPQSYNVYDSYGEALMVDGRIDLSIQNYKKSLELNPDNKNAERVIKILSEQFLNK